MLKVFLRKNINTLPFILSKTNWHSLNENKKCFMYFMRFVIQKKKAKWTYRDVFRNQIGGRRVQILSP